jgi:hypothetical protein
MLLTQTLTQQQKQDPFVAFNFYALSSLGLFHHVEAA